MSKLETLPCQSFIFDDTVAKTAFQLKLTVNSPWQVVASIRIRIALGTATMILSILMSLVKRMKVCTGNFNNSNAIITPSDHPNNKSIKNSQMKWYFFLPFLHYINGEKLRSNVQFELCFVFLTDQLNSSKKEGVQIVGAVKFNTVQKNESNRDKRDWIKTMCVCVWDFVIAFVTL